MPVVVVRGLVACGLAASLAVTPCSTVAQEQEARAWLPPGTLVLVSLDRRLLVHQPEAGVLLRIPELESRFVSSRLGAQPVRRFYVAFGSEPNPAPLALTVGDRPLEPVLARHRGARIGKINNYVLYQSSANTVLVNVSDRCVLEGRRDVVAAVVAPRATRWLDGMSTDGPVYPLLFPQREGWPVSVLYVAPDGGVHLHRILSDIERMLRLGISTSLDAYERPLRLLGDVSALRLDVRQKGRGLVGEFQLAMANRMAAQIASVSLNAGKEMARAGSDAAVRAGTMSEADARILESILDTLEARADGERVHVSVSIPDSTGS